GRPASGLTPTQDYPRALVVQRLDYEGTPALQHHRPIRFEVGNLVAQCPVELDDLADRPLLPLGMDDVLVVHLAASEVLQPVVAVEASAVLPDLRQPGPYHLDRRVHRDGSRRCGERVVDEFIAGQWLAPLLVGRSPAYHPRSDHDRV